MVRCPNCGQKTSGDYCQWCKYPILRGSPTRRREAEKRARKEAERVAKEQARREAVEARKAKEAEKRARREAERVAKEQARREAVEARKAKEAEKRARREAERVAKEQVKEKTKEAEKRARKEAERAAKEQVKEKTKEAEKAIQDIGSEIYEESVQLVVSSPVGLKQVRQFEEHLKEIENLRVVWVGGSVDVGTIIGVSLQKPMTLIRILNEMPMVEKVDKKGEKIVVMLKTPGVS